MFMKQIKISGVISIIITAALVVLLQCSSRSKAERFNRMASDPDNKPDLILKCLELQPGDKVADLGAGGEAWVE